MITAADQHFYKFTTPDLQGDLIIFDSKVLRLHNICEFILKEVHTINKSMDLLMYFNVPKNQPSNTEFDWMAQKSNAMLSHMHLLKNKSLACITRTPLEGPAFGKGCQC